MSCDDYVRHVSREARRRPPSADCRAVERQRVAVGMREHFSSREMSPSPSPYRPVINSIGAARNTRSHRRARNVVKYFISCKYNRRVVSLGAAALNVDNFCAPYSKSRHIRASSTRDIPSNVNNSRTPDEIDRLRKCRREAIASPAKTNEVTPPSARIKLQASNIASRALRAAGASSWHARHQAHRRPTAARVAHMARLANNIHRYMPVTLAPRCNENSWHVQREMMENGPLNGKTGQAQ